MAVNNGRGAVAQPSIHKVKTNGRTAMNGKPVVLRVATPLLSRSIVLALLFLAGGLAKAQLPAGAITGQTRDQSGAVVAGANVTATNKGTGLKRTAMTSAEGSYTLEVLPVGSYEIQVEKPGFSKIVQQEVSVLIGQTLTLNFSLSVGSISQSVIVTSAPNLIDTTSSDLGGSITPLQTADLPLNGRNWQDLVALAPGVKSDVGTEMNGSAGLGMDMSTKIFLDGAEATSQSVDEPNTLISADTIDQFKVLTNRFDAQYGRSESMIVNATTKSGTNNFHGTGFWFFRDTPLDAPDFFTGVKEPFEDLQTGGTIGGPIVKNRTFFFGGYEYQRSPSTNFPGTGIASLDTPVPNNQLLSLGLAKLDHQLTPDIRLFVRASGFKENTTGNGVYGPNTPSTQYNLPTFDENFVGGLNQVISSNSVNDIRFTWERHRFGNDPVVLYPELVFPDATFGTPYNMPSAVEDRYQDLRDDYSHVINGGHGSHSLKVGVEIKHNTEGGTFCEYCEGVFDFNSDPTNLATGFVGINPAQWDLSQLPAATQYTQGLGSFVINVHEYVVSAYVQDDWKISRRLTANLGVRYDAELGSLGEDFATRSDAIPSKTPDLGAIQPRLGFAWDITGKGTTVIRGGAGIYYDQVFLNVAFDQQVFNGQSFVIADVQNFPVRSNFFTDPLNGETFQQFLDGAAPTVIRPIAGNARIPRAWTESIGIQHQITPTMFISADYVHSLGFHQLVEQDTNLFCCTASPAGFPLPTTIYGRPNPKFSRIRTFETAAHSKYQGLQLDFEKRMGRHVQFGMNYLLSSNWDDTSGPFDEPNNPFNVNGDWAHSSLDERQRFAANVIGMLPFGFLASGVVHAHSGDIIGQSTGGNDLWLDGDISGDRPICASTIPGCQTAGIPNGQFFPRNTIYGKSLFRTDFRVARDFKIKERYVIEPIAEWFNVFNNKNYDSYDNNVFDTTFDQPQDSGDLTVLPRQMQVAVRFIF
jgi:hypothetical protein